jgi:hypothetical protein
MKHLSVKQFLEVVQEMPDVEAEQEIVLRKENAALELAMLNAELSRFDKKSDHGKEIGYAIQVVCADNVLLNARLKEVRARMERLKWSNAVLAVLGSEAWEACREWMAMQETTAEAATALSRQ